MESTLALLVLLILLSGAFSGAEIALTSLSPAKVRTIKGDKKFASKAIYRLKKNPETLLITILIGNNLVNIMATAIATMWGLRVFGNNAVGIVTGGLTFLILVFGEITPKTFAQKYAVGFSRVLAYPLLWLTYILYPVIWLLEVLIRGLMRLFNAHHPMRTVSEEELLAMVDIGAEEGVFEEHEQELIENVLEFTDTTVEEIMTIEKNIDGLELKTKIHEVVHFFIEHSHSRIPVYKENLDNVVSILTVHDILALLHKPGTAKILADLDHEPPIVVPKTKSISQLFNEFQRMRKHMAIVVDEHGKTVGLVTMEDILEEIVGDIVDEQDREKKTVHRIENNVWETGGDTPIEDVNEALEIDLDYPEHHTVALLILEHLGRFPKLGEKIHYNSILLQVTEMTKKQISSVQITKLKDNNDESSE